MGDSAVLLFSGSHIAITVVALPMIALAAGFNMFAAANFGAACIDLAPDFSASLSALMNMLGSVGERFHPRPRHTRRFATTGVMRLTSLQLLQFFQLFCSR
jgi:hypothetical protein